MLRRLPEHLVRLDLSFLDCDAAEVVGDIIHSSRETLNYITLSNHHHLAKMESIDDPVTRALAKVAHLESLEYTTASPSLKASLEALTTLQTLKTNLLVFGSSPSAVFDGLARLPILCTLSLHLDLDDELTFTVDALLDFLRSGTSVKVLHILDKGAKERMCCRRRRWTTSAKRRRRRGLGSALCRELMYALHFSLLALYLSAACSPRLLCSDVDAASRTPAERGTLGQTSPCRAVRDRASDLYPKHSCGTFRPFKLSGNVRQRRSRGLCRSQALWARESHHCVRGRDCTDPVVVKLLLHLHRKG